jgi:hypothetical protein
VTTYYASPVSPGQCARCHRPQAEHEWTCEGCGKLLGTTPTGSPVLHTYVAHGRGGKARFNPVLRCPGSGDAAALVYWKCQKPERDSQWCQHPDCKPGSPETVTALADADAKPKAG